MKRLLKKVINGLTGKYYIISNFQKIENRLNDLNEQINLLKKQINLLKKQNEQLKEYIILSDVKKSIENGYIDGTIFYQRELKNDTELENWIRKENYF